MAYKQKPDTLIVGNDDVAFTAWDETSGQTVEVKVSREALEDWAHPKGIRGTSDKMFAAALEDILLTVERLSDKSRGELLDSILIRTADLNP